MKSFPARGFTLIEVMIAVAIVALLAAVALPAYNSQVRKSGRTEAIAAMAAVQQAQERWRANNPAYTEDLDDIGADGTTSPGGYYTLALSSASGTGYTLTATAVAGKQQASDTGCTTLTLTVTNGDADPTPSDCWSR